MTTNPTDAPKKKTYPPLLWLGVLMMAAGVVTWYVPVLGGEEARTKEVRAASEPASTNEASEPSTSTKETVTRTRKPPSQSTVTETTTAEGVSKTTITEGTNMTTTTVDPSTGLRSETLSLTLVGIGTALALAGAFFERITSVKAGGAEFAFGSPAPETQSKVAGKIAEKITDPGKAQVAYTAAVARLPYFPGGTSPGDDVITEITEDVINQIEG